MEKLLVCLHRGIHVALFCCCYCQSCLQVSMHDVTQLQLDATLKFRRYVKKSHLRNVIREYIRLDMYFLSTIKQQLILTDSEVSVSPINGVTYISRK